MKDCSRASKCQYGCCNEPCKCGLNDDEPCYKEIEEMGYYRFDCTKCDESVLCPKKAPFLEKRM